jgi:hypothetical protein
MSHRASATVPAPAPASDSFPLLSGARLTLVYLAGCLAWLLLYLLQVNMDQFVEWWVKHKAEVDASGAGSPRSAAGGAGGANTQAHTHTSTHDNYL